MKLNYPRQKPVMIIHSVFLVYSNIIKYYVTIIYIKFNVIATFSYFCLYTSNSFFRSLFQLRYLTIFNAVENELKRSPCTSLLF